MILHASLAADNPQCTAQGLADILGGRALPMPGDGGAWMALACDDNGTVIEVLARGREYHRRDGEHCEMTWGDPRRHGATHLMIETPHTPEQLLDLANRAGFHIHRARHAVFDVFELWIDECQLLDVVTPEMALKYKQFMGMAKPQEASVA